MPEKNRFIYRATANYEDPTLNLTRHFLTKKARDAWAWRRKRGYEAESDVFDLNNRPAIPPATKVTVTKSLPVQFEEDEADA